MQQFRRAAMVSGNAMAMIIYILLIQLCEGAPRDGGTGRAANSTGVLREQAENPLLRKRIPTSSLRPPTLVEDFDWDSLPADFTSSDMSASDENNSTETSSRNARLVYSALIDTDADYNHCGTVRGWYANTAKNGVIWIKVLFNMATIPDVVYLDIYPTNPTLNPTVANEYFPIYAFPSTPGSETVAAHFEFGDSFSLGTFGITDPAVGGTGMAFYPDGTSNLLWLPIVKNLGDNGSAVVLLDAAQLTVMIGCPLYSYDESLSLAPTAGSPTNPPFRVGGRKG